MPANLPQSPNVLRYIGTDMMFNSAYLAQGVWPVNGNSPAIIHSQGGQPALATTGTDTACTNGTVYYVELYPMVNKLCTGAGYLIGSVGGTDKAIVSLYDADGTLLANSDTAGTTVGTAANLQSIAFSSTVQIYAFRRYYIGVTFNGTTAKFRTYPVPGSKFLAGSAAQTFGTPAAFTPAGTFTADKGPISFVY